MNDIATLNWVIRQSLVPGVNEDNLRYIIFSEIDRVAYIRMKAIDERIENLTADITTLQNSPK
jgi:hypothetical protein